MGSRSRSSRSRGRGRTSRSRGSRSRSWRSRSNFQAWFDQYTDTDGLSVTTDDVPSLCSMTPTTQRNR